MLIQTQMGHAGVEASRDWARQCLDLMAQHDVPPTPSNYCLWYSFVAGSIPSLRTEMGEMIRHGIAFTMQESVRLFEKYFGTDHEARSLERIGGDLTRAVNAVVKQIGQADRDSTAFGDRLKAIDGSLRSISAGDGAGVQEIILHLLQATRSMADKNQALQKELNTSSAQVSVLRDHLQQVRMEALTDGLTGIANRRCFDLKLVEQSKAAMSSGNDLCLVIIDIDHFKRFNDTYGHKVGDQVLKVVGFQLKATVAIDEVSARYGGEEFALILPNCALAQAAERADQLRETLASQYLRNKSTGESLGKVTVSIGIARYRANEPLEDFIARADGALYQAKHGGRNRVVAEAA